MEWSAAVSYTHLSVVVENDDVIVRLYNSSSESEPKKILWNFSADKMEMCIRDRLTVGRLLLEK